MHPDGIIPRQDKGYLAQRAVARFGVGAADGSGHGADRSPGPPDARRGEHGGHFRPVADRGGQRPEPGLDVRLARRVLPAPQRGPHGRRRLGGPRRSLPPRDQGGIVTAFGPPPIDGLGMTGGFKLIIEDRGDLGMGSLQQAADQVVARGNRTEGLHGLLNSSRANTPWLTWTSTARSA